MPIKPENKARYPKNWGEIRASILARAKNCCEQCGAKNRTRIARGDGIHADTYQTVDAEVFCSDSGKYLGRVRMSDYHVKKMVDIVLTIAHLDHIPENCDPSNLKALCQRCHLKYDAKLHSENARITRRSKNAIADLFAGTLELRGGAS